MIYWFNAETGYKEPPPIPVYGALWDGTSSTSWTRTDNAADFSDPNPYYAGMSGTPSSPFDDIMPWSGMVVSEDTNAGTVVAIPKFYYKLTYADTTNNTGLKIQISMNQLDGFLCSPAHQDRGDGVGERDVIYVGRYHCAKEITSSGYSYKSRTGYVSCGDATRSTMRTNIHNLGSTIWQWDFVTRFTIWLLYLVEFANWNSQEKIGYGCGDDVNLTYMGYTNNMPYHTGTTQSNRTTYGYGIQYRNIEGLWDNCYDWLDGCYYNSNGLNIILNPSNFSDSSGGTLVGLPSNGYPSVFTISNGLFYPIVSSGSTSTYSCDGWYVNTSNPCLVGGNYYPWRQEFGLFHIGSTGTTYSNTYFGSRLMILP